MDALWLLAIAAVWTYIWYKVFHALEKEGGFFFGVAAFFGIIGAIACVLLAVVSLGAVWEWFIRQPPEEWTYPGRGR